MKKTFRIITIILISIIASLFILMQFANTPNSSANGFNRIFSIVEPRVMARQDSIGNLKSISGYTDENVFFSTRDPRKIIFTGYSLKKVDSILLPLGLNREIIRLHETVVDSPTVSIYSGNFHALIKANMNSKEFTTVSIGNMTYSKVIQISPMSIIVRAFDSINFKQVFQVVDAITGKIRKQSTVIENNDGGFSTDGILRFDQSTNRLIYVQTYTNSIISLDTNLNVLYRSKTIDTTNTNSVFTRKFDLKDSTQSLIPKVPVKIINYDVSIGDSVFFVLSNLRADNESTKDTKNFMPIDVYSVMEGKYKFSFKIPLIRGSKPIKIIVNRNKLVALYPGSVVSYDIGMITK